MATARRAVVVADVDDDSQLDAEVDTQESGAPGKSVFQGQGKVFRLVILPAIAKRLYGLGPLGLG